MFIRLFVFIRAPRAEVHGKVISGPRGLQRAIVYYFDLIVYYFDKLVRLGN